MVHVDDGPGVGSGERVAVDCELVLLEFFDAKRPVSLSRSRGTALDHE